MITESASPDRQEALRPFLDKLFAIGNDGSQGDRPLHITIGERTLDVESWEREVLQKILDPSPTQPWQPLLAEGLALQAKFLSDLAKAEASTGDEEQHQRHVEELCKDATIAYALLTEMQKAIGEMVLSGKMEDAKRLTQHRNKLNQNLSLLTPVIGEDAMRQAKASSKNLVGSTPAPGSMVGSGVEDLDLAEPSVQELLALEEQLQNSSDENRVSGVQKRAAQAQAKAKAKGKTKGKGKDAKQNEQKAKSKSLPARFGVKEQEDRKPATIKLIAVLAASLIGWVVLQGVPMMNHVEIPEVTLADFGAISQIEDVMARPPSLYVQVNEYEWQKLSDRERTEVVQSIGNKVSELGYQGAHVQGGSGRTLAQWLKQKGSIVHPVAKTE